MIMELRKTFQFEAAHFLPHLPTLHKCRRLHGHSFKVEVVVEGECDAKLGWVMDYAEIADAFKPILEKLDHYHLNEIPGLENPTSENIAVFCWMGRIWPLHIAQPRGAKLNGKIRISARKGDDITV